MYHGSNTWEMKCCIVKFQRSRLLLLPKEWDSAGTAGEARMNLLTSYYNGNQHMAKELAGDQNEHSLINWLMTLNYRNKISQMRWMTESIGKAKLWLSDCGRPGRRRFGIILTWVFSRVIQGKEIHCIFLRHSQIVME